MNEKRTFTIGRNPACHIVLADDRVSKKHAEITFLEGGKIQLTDANTVNGTYILKGEEFKKLTKPTFISPTDTVMFGPCEMTVKDLLENLRLIAGPDLEKSPPPKPANVQGVELVRCQDCGFVKQAGQPCPNPKCRRETLS